jgi:ribokinase
MTPKIVVIGSFVVGITIRVPRPPVLGEGLIGDLFDMGPGGKGTNQAIAAARQGAHVDLVTCIGDDIFADFAIRLYQRERIVTDHVHRIPNINTGVGCVTLLPSGENSIVGHLGANMHLRPEHVDAAESLIAQSDVVLTQYEAPFETIARAMELGHKHQKLTIWNPAPAKAFDRALLKHIDLMTPNESETRILLGLPPDDPTPTDELARRLLDMGVKRIVVTLGKRGSMIVMPEGSELIPPLTIKALDATGAGDSFNASLAVRLAQGMQLRDAAREANAAGAYTCMHLGVVDGLPTRDELAAFTESLKSGK